MNARQIYATLFDPRGPVHEAGGEWRFIGDTGCFDAARLKQIVDSEISGPQAYVAVSRHNATEVPLAAVPELVREYLDLGKVRIANLGLTRFAEVDPAGVVRSWRHDA